MIGKLRRVFIVVILGEQPVGAIVGVGDTLPFGIHGFDEVRGIVVGVGRNAAHPDRS
jgi:hypothetical protein